MFRLGLNSIENEIFWKHSIWKCFFTDSSKNVKLFFVFIVWTFLAAFFGKMKTTFSIIRQLYYTFVSESTIDDSRDRLRKATYKLKTKPLRENKIKMSCDLDMNSGLTNFFVRNIDHEIDIVVKKKVKAKKNEETV